MSIKDLIDNSVKELKFRNLGCCGGDNCPNYEPIRDNDGNSTASNHDEALEQFISDQIQKAYSEGREEMETKYNIILKFEGYCFLDIKDLEAQVLSIQSKEK